MVELYVEGGCMEGKRPGFGGAIEMVRLLRNVSIEELSSKVNFDVNEFEQLPDEKMNPESLARVAGALKIRTSLLGILADDDCDFSKVRELRDWILAALVKNPKTDLRM